MDVEELTTAPKPTAGAAPPDGWLWWRHHGHCALNAEAYAAVPSRSHVSVEHKFCLYFEWKKLKMWKILPHKNFVEQMWGGGCPFQGGKVILKHKAEARKAGPTGVRLPGPTGVRVLWTRLPTARPGASSRPGSHLWTVLAGPAPTASLTLHSTSHPFL